MADTVTALSHWQFAMSGLLHFLFIPLTLGVSLLLLIIESIQMAGARHDLQPLADVLERVFKLAFVMAIATRLPIVLQFGANGSYFSHYAGDAFALPLALEGLSSLFLAALVFGPYSSDWARSSRKRHWLLTGLLVLAMHLSAFWIVLSHSWMQHPVATAFNDQSYRLELLDFQGFIANPVVPMKWLHTVVGSYACAAAAAMMISLYHPMPWQPIRSVMLIAGITGLAATGLSAIGDPTPQQPTLTQSIKRSIIEGDKPERWLGDLQAHIQHGIDAFRRLEQLRDDNPDPSIRADFDQLKTNLGYAWLLKPFSKHIAEANEKQIRLAAQAALPAYPGVILWSYRLMMAAGLLSLTLFAWMLWQSRQANAPSISSRRWMTALALSPWVASIAGWAVSEFGKQPWAIAGQLPSASGVSASTPSEAVMTLVVYLLAYAALLTAGWQIAKVWLFDTIPDTTGAQS